MSGHIKSGTLRSGMPGRPGAKAAATAAEPLSMRLLRMDAAEIRALGASRREFPAIAPIVPMKLIRPIAEAKAGGRSTAQPSWGLEAVGALDCPMNGCGVTVAVLDTGINRDHPAFKNVGIDIEMENFTTDQPGDTDGHGTHCAGTIFGRDVGGKRIGIARGVGRALIAKVFGETSGGGSDVIAEAIKWAVSKRANVVSMSLGIDFPGYVNELIEEDDVPRESALSMGLQGYRETLRLFEALGGFVEGQAPFGEPALLIAASGNESQRDAKRPFEIGTGPPAVCGGYISVGAVGKSKGGLVVAPFSNTGARVCAPGVDIVSANLSGGLIAFSGTSMATPHVAGVAALWAQKLKQEDAFRLQAWTDRLMGSTSTAKLKAGFDTLAVGSGLIKAPTS